MSARKKIASCHPDRVNYYMGKCESCYKYIQNPEGPCPHDNKPKDYHGRCSTCMSQLYRVKRKQGVGRNFGTPRVEEIINRRRGPDYEPMRWRQKKIKELSEKQGGKCAICGETDKKGLCLDHDHRCCPQGKACEKCIRGALCHGCNMRLGQLESDLVGRSLDYLLRHQGGPMAVNDEVRVTSSTGGSKGQKLARFDLIPVAANWELAETYGRGALKYEDPYNWKKGYNWSLSYQAMVRHANAFWAGQSRDPKDANHHLASVAWHAFALMTFEREGLGKDDRIHNYPQNRSDSCWGIDVSDGIGIFEDVFGPPTHKDGVLIEE